MSESRATCSSYGGTNELDAQIAFGRLTDPGL